jgi:predicted transcriptional regulator
MASNKTRGIVLLPIHPQYAKLIMAGQKQVEFRKIRFSRTISHVVVYVTSPLKHVVGFFEVSEVVEASPLSLWRRFHKIGGIRRKDFAAYFAEKDKGVAIKIKKVWSLSKPQKLNAIYSFKAVPQSFAYLPVNLLPRLQVRSN